MFSIIVQEYILNFMSALRVGHIIITRSLDRVGHIIIKRSLDWFPALKKPFQNSFNHLTITLTTGLGL